MILLLTATNLSGLKTGKIIQNTFTFTKTAALLGLIVVGLTIGWKVGMQNGSAAFTSSWWNPTLNGWNPQGLASRIRRDRESYPRRSPC
jgi:APA family basic amino acid/polyamine antiporter